MNVYILKGNNFYEEENSPISMRGETHPKWRLLMMEFALREVSRDAKRNVSLFKNGTKTWQCIHYLKADFHKKKKKTKVKQNKT